MATEQLKGPTQRLEFVAKRLLFGQDKEGQTVLLGTPLYVAMCE